MYKFGLIKERIFNKKRYLSDTFGNPWKNLYTAYPHPYYIATDSNKRIIAMFDNPKEMTLGNVIVYGIDDNQGYTYDYDGTIYNNKAWDEKTNSIVDYKVPYPDNSRPDIDTLGYMTQSTYDPDKIKNDTFNMDNMKEGNNKLILTSEERDKIKNSANKNITITGTDGLTGGGDLNNNLEIKLSEETKNKLKSINSLENTINNLGALSKKDKVEIIDIDGSNEALNEQLLSKDGWKSLEDIDNFIYFLKEKCGNNLIINGNFDIKINSEYPNQWQLHENGQLYQKVPNMLSGTYTLWWDGGDKGFWTNENSPVIANHIQTEDKSGFICVPRTARRVVLLKGDWITNYHLTNPWNLVKRTLEEEKALCFPKNYLSDDSNYAKLDKDNNFTGSMSVNKKNADIKTTEERSHIHTTGKSSFIFTGGANADIYTSGDEANIYTSGNKSHIFTNSKDSNIYTLNDDSSIYTDGKRSHIYTGGGGHIIAGLTRNFSGDDLRHAETNKNNGRLAGDGAFIKNYDIGSIKFFLTNKVPENYLRPDGSLLSRSSYPELWEFARTSGMIVSDGEWLDTMGDAETGIKVISFGKFSYGDGSTNFRIPLLGGEFIRILSNDDSRDLDKNRTLGSMQDDAIRNIKGTLGWTFSISDAKYNPGALYWNTKTSRSMSTVSGNTTNSYDGISFDASRSVPTANENRPVNVAYNAFIRAL